MNRIFASGDDTHQMLLLVAELLPTMSTGSKEKVHRIFFFFFISFLSGLPLFKHFYGLLPKDVVGKEKYIHSFWHCDNYFSVAGSPFSTISFFGRWTLSPRRTCEINLRDLGKAPMVWPVFSLFAVLRKDLQPSTGISVLNDRRTQNILHKHVLREVVGTNNSGQESKYIQCISWSVSHRSVYLSISKHLTFK